MTDSPNTLAVKAVWGGDYRCEVTARQHVITVDEPESARGSDTGPTPTELFLASLGSCFTLALGHVAAKRGVAIRSIEIEVTGVYEGPSFSDLAMEIAVDSDADDTRIDELVERAKAVCYVSNTLAHPPPVTVRRATDSPD